MAAEASKIGTPTKKPLPPVPTKVPSSVSDTASKVSAAVPPLPLNTAANVTNIGEIPFSHSGRERKGTSLCGDEKTPAKSAHALTIGQFIAELAPHKAVIPINMKHKEVMTRMEVVENSIMLCEGNHYVMRAREKLNFLSEDTLFFLDIFEQSAHRFELEIWKLDNSEVAKKTESLAIIDTNQQFRKSASWDTVVGLFSGKDLFYTLNL